MKMKKGIKKITVICAVMISILSFTPVAQASVSNETKNQSQDMGFKKELLSKEEYTSKVKTINGQVPVINNIENAIALNTEKSNLKATNLKANQYVRFSRKGTGANGSFTYGFYATVYNSGSFREFVSVSTAFVEGSSVNSYNASATKVNGNTVHFYAHIKIDQATNTTKTAYQSDYFYLY
ncbi:hypothetical protein IA938_04490 [Listeria welshimeri]|uniref:hypothetical protein n=1 Tax=Listeria welshimeri TaxID=1643 RepID=UPI0018889756|nr:hypothetical protein [Listeria welshimeri]MBF2508540.1 hypothetical protein [Listeria welshimeri]MBF2560182.1 hypothetical protein [Listeria welshimeri]MBF2565909.1 hypothetical protein [Listeria welshimeri]MBF2579340.1 hypothetical protein [Listeria welshimeri]MBF2582328.1 hypothetical protein [Listeria welshimeri]